jgi:hypothetical protein
MRTRILEALCVILLATVAALNFGCSRTSQAATIDFGPGISKAVENARTAQASDEISSILRDTKTLPLQGSSLSMVSRMAVADNDELLILDAFSRGIRVFSPKGEYKHQLGQNGQTPGQYITPTDVIAAGNDIAVDDFTVHRINHYSPDGSFARSFIYSAQAFGSSRLAHFPKSGQAVLFGNKWLPQPSSSMERSAFLVNIYDRDGRYQRSTFQFPDRFLKLNMVADDAPEAYVDGVTDTIYFALPFEYKVYALNSSGDVSVVLNLTSPKFKEPSTRCDPKAGPEGVKAFQSWLLTWTPIVAVWKSGSDLMIEYQTFDPLRYTVDIRDAKSQRLIKQLGTNYRYLTTDSRDRHWFVKDLMPATGQEELLIGRGHERIQ